MKSPVGLIGIIGIIVGIIGGVFGVTVAIQSNLKSSSPDWSPFIVLGVAFIVMFFSFFPFIKKAMENSQKKKRLQQVGQRTQATVLEVRDTGLTVNNNPYIEVTVELKGIKTKFSTMVSRVGIPRPGDIIEVLYDPSDPTVVMAAP